MVNFHPILSLILVIIAAFLVSYSLIPAIIKLVKENNFYAMPNERTSHIEKTPTLGGIAIYISFLIVFPIFTWKTDWESTRFLIAALTIMFSIGIKDDILAISPFKKMLGQLISTSLMVLGADVRLTHLHGFFGIEELPYLVSVTFSIVIYLGVINAYNFIDGIDGLASGMGILHATIFGIWFFWSGNFSLAVLSFTLVGSLIGFFYHNVYSTDYKIFMGDTGSLVLGLLMSILALKFNELNITQTQPWSISSAPSVTFAIMGLPLFDMLRIVFIRKVLGLSISSPDKRHLHHQMLRLGLSHRQSTYWLIVFSCVFAGFGLYFQFISIRRLLLIELLLAMFLAYLPSLIYQHKNKAKKKKN